MIRLFKEMQLKCVTSDLRTFTIAFQKCQNDAEYRYLLESFCKSKMDPDLFTYTAMICAAAKYQGIESAEQLFRDIDRWNIKPDAILLAAMINMHFKHKNYARCRVLYAMISSLKIKPDSRTQSLMRQCR